MVLGLGQDSMFATETCFAATFIKPGERCFIPVLLWWVIGVEGEQVTSALPTIEENIKKQVSNVSQVAGLIAGLPNWCHASSSGGEYAEVA